MKYKLNQFVKVKSLNQVKKIVDFEIINDLNLYYMSDVTAYPESELDCVDCDDLEKLVRNKILSKDHIEELANNLANTLREYKLRKSQ